MYRSQDGSSGLPIKEAWNRYCWSYSGKNKKYKENCDKQLLKMAERYLVALGLNFIHIFFLLKFVKAKALIDNK